MSLSLRPVQPTDIALFLAYHRAPEALTCAGYSLSDAPNAQTFQKQWDHMMVHPDYRLRTIIMDDKVTGYVAQFSQEGRPSVSYWLGPDHWGRGIATAALGRFLAEIAICPLYALTEPSNKASQKVLAKNGFQCMGEVRLPTKYPGNILFKRDDI